MKSPLAGRDAAFAQPPSLSALMVARGVRGDVVVEGVARAVHAADARALFARGLLECCAGRGRVEPFGYVAALTEPVVLSAGIELVEGARLTPQKLRLPPPLRLA